MKANSGILDEMAERVTQKFSIHLFVNVLK